MDIKGPIKIGVVEPSPEGNYELHIDFVEDFRKASLEHQREQFRAYLAELHEASQAGTEDQRSLQGLLLVQQICEQLAPHIDSGDLALADTLVVEVQRTPGVNLAELLRQ